MHVWYSSAHALQQKPHVARCFFTRACIYCDERGKTVENVLTMCLQPKLQQLNDASLDITRSFLYFDMLKVSYIV